MRRFFDVVTPDLYKYKVLRLSYENASIFAAFALMAFIPGSPYKDSISSLVRLNASESCCSM